MKNRHDLVSITVLDWVFLLYSPISANIDVLLFFESRDVLELHGYVDTCHVESVFKLSLVCDALGVTTIWITPECSSNTPNETLVVLKRKCVIQFLMVFVNYSTIQ